MLETTKSRGKKQRIKKILGIQTEATQEDEISSKLRKRELKAILKAGEEKQ